MTDQERFVVVERQDTTVMFLRGRDEQVAISSVWADLEDRIGPLRGRRFYGVFDPHEAEYRACVQIHDGDRPEELGLERGVLAGGRYARVRLRGKPPGVYQLIGPTFRRLARRSDHDTARPDIEFYRRRDVIYLLSPIT